MKAIIKHQEGVWLITLMNDEFKDTIVVDELYLGNSKVNSNDFEIAEWIAKEVKL
jgi:hypothetical protein